MKRPASWITYGLFSSLLAVGATIPAQATDYPSRAIRLIVPYAPGGSADISARLIGDEWSKQLGQPIVIENRAGAGGNIGVDTVAKAKPDGYMIGLHTVSLAINPAIFPNMPFDTLKDLAPIGTVASSQHVLAINPSVKADSVKTLIKLAKDSPGQLTYGSAGAGSTFHMSAELFKALAQTDILHVPYRGGGPAMVDTIAGQVDMSFPVLSAALPHIKAGTLKALGVTGPQRSALLPDTPYIAEAGLPDYSFETWFMTFAPAGTPEPVIEKLNQSLNAALTSDALRQRMIEQGFDPLPSTVAQAKERLESELPAWSRLVQERGIKIE